MFHDIPGRLKGDMATSSARFLDEAATRSKQTNSLHAAGGRGRAASRVLGGAAYLGALDAAAKCRVHRFIGSGGFARILSEMMIEVSVVDGSVLLVQQSQTNSRASLHA